MGTILSWLFSTRFMAVLLFIFAVSMAAGTFIESSYNTNTARLLVYNTFWFEAIIGLLAFNFIGNIKRYKLYKKSKWSVLVLHLAFIIIIAGAFISRYYGFEGIMPIAEGQTTNKMYADEIVLSVQIDKKKGREIKRRILERSLRLSPKVDNAFSMNTTFEGQQIKLELLDYVMNAVPEFSKDSLGDRYLKIVESSSGKRREHYLKEGKVKVIGGQPFSFGRGAAGAISFLSSDSLVSPQDGTVFNMSQGKTGSVKKYQRVPLKKKALYTINDLQFVVPESASRGVLSFASNNNFKDQETPDILVLKLQTNGQEQKVTLTQDISGSGSKHVLSINGLSYTFHYGRRVIELPFEITLNDFIAEKYPGSEQSYVSFESQVTIHDDTDSFNARIFMNHVLDHQGYRFFQASFYPNEKGTILSVNHDQAGTYTTYTGYFLLYLGLIAILFDKNSRFSFARRALNRLRQRKLALAIVSMILVIPASVQSQHLEVSNANEIDSMVQKLKVSQKHSREFGKLVIQDSEGRMKPINTFSSELLRKIGSADSYKGLEADQVLLSMVQFPKIWYQAPIIKLKKDNKAIRMRLGLGMKVTHASLSDFYDQEGLYKLTKHIDDAYRARIKNQYQKDLIEADRKASLLYYVLNGEALKIFPVPDSPENKWIASGEVGSYKVSGRDSAFVAAGLTLYLASVYQAIQSQDYTQAENYLTMLRTFQKKHGSEIIPSEQKIRAEVLYNRYDVFKKLFIWYLIAAMVLLILDILNIFNQKKYVQGAVQSVYWLILLIFAVHTTGLITRAVISGHAPWSDAYETMIYIAWSTMLFGLIFGNKSKLTIAATAFVVAMILMVAHWNWLDPAIANLQPVLDSYWLMIHVAIIVASYGPFTLGMILGLVNLHLMIAMSKGNKQRLTITIREINYIIELTVTIGLVMLAIGNFLGAQWANESWGRYWAWDPKETWALISIMVYAFVIHMRLIPALKSEWSLSVMAVLAYGSILMTYFGVNFYLEGLHSYASGEKVITPNFIFYAVVFIAIVAFLSYKKTKKYSL